MHTFTRQCMHTPAAGFISDGVGLHVQVLGGGSGPHSADSGHRMLMGNMCLLANTLAMSIYYLLAKQLVSK